MKGEWFLIFFSPSFPVFWGACREGFVLLEQKAGGKDKTIPLSHFSQNHGITATLLWGRWKSWKHCQQMGALQLPPPELLLCSPCSSAGEG